MSALEEAQAELDRRRAERIKSLPRSVPKRQPTMGAPVGRLKRAQRNGLAVAMELYLISRIPVRGFYLQPTIANMLEIQPGPGNRIMRVVGWLVVAYLAAVCAVAAIR